MAVIWVNFMRAWSMRGWLAALGMAALVLAAHPAYWAPFIVVGEGAVAR